MPKPWEKYGNTGVVAPADPYKVEDQQMQREAARRAAAAAERANANAAEQIRLARERFEFEKQKALNDPNNAKSDQKLANLRALEQQLADVRAQYESGFKGGDIVDSMLDYVPSQRTRAFNSAGAGLGDVGLAAFRTPGIGQQSDAELRAFIQANRPSSSDFDSEIEQKLTNLERRLNATYQEMGIARPQVQLSPQVRGTAPADQPAGPIATGGQADIPVPPAMLAELQGYLRARRGQGVDDQDFAAFYNDLARRNNYQGGTPESLKAYIRQFNETGTIGPVTPAKRETSEAEQLRNSFLTTGPGAFAANAANMGAFGIPQALAGDQAFEAILSESPVSSALGQVAGAITGTGAIGRVGGMAAGKFAPRLLGGGSKGQFGRNLLTDATYGGLYGETTEGNPLEGAALAAGGSVLGQGAGSLIGRGLTGATAPIAQRLNDAGIPLTLGQIMRARSLEKGGRSMVAGAEDVLANTRFLDSLVGARRAESTEGGVNAAFNVARGGAGQPIRGVGEEALDQLGAIKGQAYEDALSGVSVPADERFIQQMQEAAAFGRSVDEARGKGDFGYIMNRQIAPIAGDAPEISGRQLQDILRLTQSKSRAYSKAANGPMPDPMAGGVSDALGKVTDAVTGVTARGAPQVIPKLKDANRINRNLMILDDASGRGIDQGGVFTPSQLGMAIKANDKTLGGKGLSSAKKSPLYQLQQDMQAVLPNKIPPTGVNTAPALAIGGALLGAGGVATDQDYLKAAGLAALLATPYTKAGQKAAVAALLKRPASVKAIGNKVRKRKGLFGTAAAAPILVSDQ